jgi:terminase large subunit-like protein
MSSYVVGMDCGQVSDPSAVAVLRVEGGGKYDLVHIDRLPLGMGYPNQVRTVVSLLERVDQRGRREQIAAILANTTRLSGDPIPRPPRTPLVIDGTGVGRAVADQFREAGLGPRLTTISITAGGTVAAVGASLGVPKRDMVATLQVVFQSKRLRIANKLPLANAFVTEMLAFRVKLSAQGHDSYGAEAGEHDDLVLAVGCALWHCEWERTNGRRLDLKDWQPIYTAG